MSIPYDRQFNRDLNRFQASNKFFIKFTQACYKFHVTSMYGSIMFDHTFFVRNDLNPLCSNFVERMIQDDDHPGGGKRMFPAMKKGAELFLEANTKKGSSESKYPNAVLRLIVISGGNDQCDIQEQAEHFRKKSESIQSLFLMNFQKNLLRSLDILVELLYSRKVLQKDLIYLAKKNFLM